MDGKPKAKKESRTDLKVVTKEYVGLVAKFRTD